jgi:hypothetical protein
MESSTSSSPPAKRQSKSWNGGLKNPRNFAKTFPTEKHRTGGPSMWPTRRDRDAYRLRVRAAAGASGAAGAAGAAGADGADGADGAAADCAIAGEFIVVDSSIVIAGGTTTANLPAVARKARRSVPSCDRVSCGSILLFLH